MDVSMEVTPSVVKEKERKTVCRRLSVGSAGWGSVLRGPVPRSQYLPGIRRRWSRSETDDQVNRWSLGLTFWSAIGLSAFMKTSRYLIAPEAQAIPSYLASEVQK